MNNTQLNHEAAPPADGPENFDLTNNERAGYALAGLLGFVGTCSTDDEDLVADFLCDLMHLMDRMPKTYGSFDEQLQRARNNYEAEISPQRGPLANPAPEANT